MKPVLTTCKARALPNVLLLWPALAFPFFLVLIFPVGHWTLIEGIPIHSHMSFLTPIIGGCCLGSLGFVTSLVMVEPSVLDF